MAQGRAGSCTVANGAGAKGNTGGAMSRQEFDSFGAIEVNEARMWGAQTQRSL
jgi:hypothetical protein